LDVDHLVLDSVVERGEREPDGFDCFREGSLHRLQLWGMLPSGWAGNLALHVAAAGIEVVSGDAIRTAGSRWAATFLIRSGGSGEPRRHDFLQMARRAPRGLPPLPEPEVALAVRISEIHAGNCFVHVTGKDSIGLMGNLLRRFARFGLEPRQFKLRTTENGIRDWFWLETIRR